MERQFRNRYVVSGGTVDFEAHVKPLAKRLPAGVRVVVGAQLLPLRILLSGKTQVVGSSTATEALSSGFSNGLIEGRRQFNFHGVWR